MDPEQDTLPGVEDEPGTLDLDTLKMHLWEVADILRGNIDYFLAYVSSITDDFDGCVIV